MKLSFPAPFFLLTPILPRNYTKIIDVTLKQVKCKFNKSTVAKIGVFASDTIRVKKVDLALKLSTSDVS